jgi:PAS domain S-box-containing protein
MCYAVDEEGRLVWWNEEVRETTGYDESTLEGLEVFDLLPPEQRDDARAAFEHTGSFPDEVSLTFDLVTSDGERIPHEFNGARLEIRGKTVVVGVGRGITNRRERERKRALRRRQDELETLNRINETVYEVIRSVIDAATREGIEEVTCRRLADSGLYRAVWMGRTTTDDGVNPCVGVGEPEDFLETVEALNGEDWRRPAQAAIETGELRAVQSIPDSELPAAAREAAVQLGVESGVAVPIVYGDRVDGVLSVYSSRPDGFNDREQAAFRRLGTVVGFAIHAVRTEQLVLSDAATELTFRVTGPDAPLASLSEHAGGPCRHEWSTPTDSGTYRHFVTAPGLDVEAAAEMLEGNPTVESVARAGMSDDGDTLELVTNASFISRLLEIGASPASLVARNGETTVVAEVPGETHVRPVVEAVEELYDAELVSKRSVDRPVRTPEKFRDPVDSRLTDSQLAALRHAYFSGYFSWPREATAEDVAAAMDISSATLHYHLRRAQETLVEAYLQYVEK